MTMMLTTYLASLSPLALLRSLPGACAQGLIWGLLALGVYITYKLLDFADLTVDGSMATGGAVAVMLIRAGMNPWLALIFAFLAGMAAGFITGMLHTALGIPGILASILTQISLYSINLNILGSSNQAVSVDKYSLVVSLRYISDSTASKIRMFTTCILFCVVLVAILYWYFGTEQGHAIRATGCNRQMARAQGINTDFHTVLALMISNGLVGLSGGLLRPVSGSSGCQYGTWCDRYRTCCCYHWRCPLWKNVCRQKNCICLHTVLRHCRSYPVLPCFKCCFMVEIPIRRPEIILCNCSSYLPFNSISESET